MAKRQETVLIRAGAWSIGRRLAGPGPYPAVIAERWIGGDCDQMRLWDRRGVKPTIPCVTLRVQGHEVRMSEEALRRLTP